MYSHMLLESRKHYGFFIDIWLNAILDFVDVTTFGHCSGTQQTVKYQYHEHNIYLKHVTIA